MDDLGLDGFSWVDGGNEHTLDIIITIVFAPKPDQGRCKSQDPLVHLIGSLIISHNEIPFFTLALIKLGGLNALVPNKEHSEVVPYFLGGAQIIDVCRMSTRHGLLKEILGGGIELLINFFPSGQVERIMRCKAILYDPQKMSRRTKNMRFY
jgi:hypothetical protein